MSEVVPIIQSLWKRLFSPPPHLINILNVVNCTLQFVINYNIHHIFTAKSPDQIVIFLMITFHAFAPAEVIHTLQKLDDSGFKNVGTMVPGGAKKVLAHSSAAFVWTTMMAA